MREISRSTGLGVDVIRLWKNKFQSGDLSWVKAGKDKKKLSSKEKEEALRLHFQEGKSSIESLEPEAKSSKKSQHFP